MKLGALLVLLGAIGVVEGRELLGRSDVEVWAAALCLGGGLALLAVGGLRLASGRPRWRRVAGATIGTAVLFAGIDLAGLRSGVALAAGMSLVLGGGGLALRALFFQSGESERRIGRFILLNGAAVVLALGLAAGYRLGPSEQWLVDQRVNLAGAISRAPDGELGWAPQGAGFVGTHLDPIRPGAHVLFLGDSIVQGTGVEAHEAAPALMDAALPEVQVLNAGVAGYSIDQYLLYGRRLLPSLNADLVLVGVFTGNDYEVTGMEWGWGRGKPLFEAIDGQLVAAGQAGRCIDNLVQSLLLSAVWSDRDLAVRLVEWVCRPRRLSPGETDAVLPLLFDALEADAAVHGARVLWLLLAEEDQHIRSRYTAYKSRYPDLRRLLLAGGHDVVDVSERLARAGEAGMFLEDGAHLTVAGHAWLAAELAPEIRSRRAPKAMLPR